MRFLYGMDSGFIKLRHVALAELADDAGADLIPFCGFSEPLLGWRPVMPRSSRPGRLVSDSQIPTVNRVMTGRVFASHAWRIQCLSCGAQFWSSRLVASRGSRAGDAAVHERRGRPSASP